MPQVESNNGFPALTSTSSAADFALVTAVDRRAELGRHGHLQ